MSLVTMCKLFGIWVDQIKSWLLDGQVVVCQKLLSSSIKIG